MSQNAAAAMIEAREIDAYAQKLFKERWPGKSWDGHGVNRAYWRRLALKALTWQP